MNILNPNPSREKKPKAMKTSILISSIAALCLMITLAEAPHHNVNEKISTGSISRSALMPAHQITLFPRSEKVTSKWKAENGKPVEKMDDNFSYLKFRINDLQDGISASTTADSELPEISVTELNYLQFDVLKYMAEPLFPNKDLSELPDKQIITNEANPTAQVETEFGYLKFSISNLTTENEPDRPGIGSLPEEPEKENYNLRFDVRKYYNTENLNSGIPADLPAIE